MIARRGSDFMTTCFYKMDNIPACHFDADGCTPVDREYLIIRKEKIAEAMSLRKIKGDGIKYAMGKYIYWGAVHPNNRIFNHKCRKIDGKGQW